MTYLTFREVQGNSFLGKDSENLRVFTFTDPSVTGGTFDLGEPDESEEVAVADVADVTSPRAFVTRFY
jgi:hypothetical protein